MGAWTREIRKQACHSTLPFENPFDRLTVLSNVEGLKVLSPSAVRPVDELRSSRSGPNGIVEGLMALSRIEGLGSEVREYRAQRDGRECVCFCLCGAVAKSL